MNQFYCNGKKNICDVTILCEDCAFCDNSGGEWIRAKETNADKIRAMSDRQLADFLAERYAAESILRLIEAGYEVTATELAVLKEQLCRTWLKWLVQPATEE